MSSGNNSSPMTKVLDSYRDPELGKKILAQVQRWAEKARQRLGYPPVVMEVCGTHTVAISRLGLRSLLNDKVILKSGPGCPVCVTGQQDIDRAIALAQLPNVTVATFGDMVRVPGSSTSLEEIRARGGRIQVFYSPEQAVEFACGHTETQVVFLAVGFETTIPAIALALKNAQTLGASNFYILSLHKLVPPVMRALLTDAEVRVDGYLLPGHVSTITGRNAFDFVGTEFGVPAVVTGFELIDILLGLAQLLKLVAEGNPQVINGYPRLVREQGNLRAQAMIEEYFEPCLASWRGLGSIQASGLKLRSSYQKFDAEIRFPIEVPTPRIPAGCGCGEVLKGKISPPECRLFGRVCRPERPVGPCMVSSEGACSAYYQYEIPETVGGGEGGVE